MKKILGILLSLAFSVQTFAAGKIDITVKDEWKKNAPHSRSLEIFSVATPLYGKFDYLTISAAASDGAVSVVKVHKDILKNLQMDVASFMIILTSKDTKAMVMCLDAEIVNERSYVCQRLAVNALAQ